jgi:hypothetical protein
VNPAQLVLGSTVAIVAVCVALICVGVGMLTCVAWSLIFAGVLSSLTAVVCAVVLLHDDGRGK